MRAQDLPAVIARKVHTPSTWGAVLVFGLVWGLVRLFIGLPGALGTSGELCLPFLLAAGQVGLAPLPWLWTGDERPQAPPVRGLLQAVPWNVLWLGGCVGLLGLAVGTGFHADPARLKLHLPGTPGGIPLRPEWGLILLNLPFCLLMGWFLADKERAEAAERESRRLADLARAQALQAQLNPHVLFNVLGGLTELVHEDPDAAEEALVGLVDMYRDLMRHGVARTAPLAGERSLLRRYLGIEEIRLGERLRVEWAWPAWADALELPPLLLQPLVENAVKHGVAPAPAGGTIRISAERAPGALVLRVANTGRPLAADRSEGTGLRNLRERLALLAAWSPSFALRQDSGWTTAELTLAWRWKP